MSEATTSAPGGQSDHGDEEHEHFSVFKIFITLLVLTALEVAWGVLIPYENKALLWSGLLGFAVWKGSLIFLYFMHMKYEGIIVKGNVLFTIPLVIYMMTMLLPDTAFNSRMNYNIGDQLDVDTGEVVSIGADDEQAHGEEHGEEHD